MGGNIEKVVLSLGLSLQHFLKEEQNRTGSSNPHQPTHAEVIFYENKKEGDNGFSTKFHILIS